MATEKVTIFRNDTPQLRFTLTDTAGAAFDLTTVSEVRFAAKADLRQDNSEAIINSVCTIEAPPTGGICTVDLVAGDTDDAGTFTGEIQLTFTSGKILTASQFELVIAQDVLQ